MHGSTRRHLCHRIVTIATCLVLATLPSSTAAHQPTPVHSMAFATVGEHTLYVKGGRTSNGRVVNQFFALDLTVQSWDTANPPWKELTDLTTTNNSTASTAVVFPSYHALSVSQEKDSLTVWTPGGFKVDYSIRDDTWTPISGSVASFSKGSLGASNGFQAVTDPTTGLVYIPGGYQNNMLVFNSTDNKVTTVPMPQTLEFPHWAHYSFVWSQAAMSFFFFGGSGKTTHDSSSPLLFWEYFPSTKSWIRPQLSGSFPGPSTSSCLVAAHNGTKIILFGGRRGDALLGDLHILDVRTRIWTQERRVGPNDNRADMACSVAGDHFVVWGGMLSKTAHFSEDTSGTPLIFNLRSKRWATQFVRDRKVAMSALSKRSPSDDIGVILGVVGGIVALIILCCFLTALRWHMEEQSERRLKAMEGLQQKVPQYNTHNNEPVDLIPWSADKMEIQSASTGVAYGQTTYTAPTTVLMLGPSSSPQSHSPSPFPQQATWPAQSSNTTSPSAPSYPPPIDVYSGSSGNTKDPALSQQSIILPARQQHPHTHVVDAPSSSSTSSSPKIVRSPQDRSEPAPIEESPQELARQIRVMQAELQRLQAKLDR